MAYNGFKGIGPRGLGTSPLKQTDYRNPAGEKEVKYANVKDSIPRSALEPKSGMGAMGLIGGTAVKAGVGLVKGAINLGKKFFSKSSSIREANSGSKPNLSFGYFSKSEIFFSE